jgi:hypothetical protein
LRQNQSFMTKKAEPGEKKKKESVSDSVCW